MASEVVVSDVLYSLSDRIHVCTVRVCALLATLVCIYVDSSDFRQVQLLFPDAMPVETLLGIVDVKITSKRVQVCRDITTLNTATPAI